jgi:hypothetical protein
VLTDYASDRIQNHVHDGSAAMSVDGAFPRIAQYRLTLLHLVREGAQLFDRNDPSTP